MNTFVTAAAAVLGLAVPAAEQIAVRKMITAITATGPRKSDTALAGRVEMRTEVGGVELQELKFKWSGAGRSQPRPAIALAVAGVFGDERRARAAAAATRTPTDAAFPRQS